MLCCLFFCNAPATTEIYTLSLHDALPISSERGGTTTTCRSRPAAFEEEDPTACVPAGEVGASTSDRKSTRLNSSHVEISYAVFCLKKKNKPCTRSGTRRRCKVSPTLRRRS